MHTYYVCKCCYYLTGMMCAYVHAGYYSGTNSGEIV